MSLAIEVGTVQGVLLADGWNEVSDFSFTIDAYEFVGDEDRKGNVFVYHGGGASGISSAGFAFVNLQGDQISGPLTAILAVRT